MSELDRVMIHRSNRRILEDGCVDCGKSVLYCQAVREMEGRPCCEDTCHHPT